MELHWIDWAVIGLFVLAALVIGVVVARRAGKNTEEFFLSGRNMPWWLLGMSMVATTFAADTPLLVTDIVRNDGVAGNWVWWAFLLTGMLTVFVYAKLWRRSGVMTDMEFYEQRYSGKPAAFLRGFRAVYLGLVFNILIMGVVTLAATKIANVLMGLDAWQTVLIAGVATLIYSALGGLRGVLLTDFLLFIISMGGAIAAAVVAVNHPDVGGLDGLVSHAAVEGKLAILPSVDFSSWDSIRTLIPLMAVPLAVQWWAAWYPGSEPGGGGYLAQRMLAAEDERHATGAVLFFNAAHFAVRPWPWILVALASLIVFPTERAIQDQLPHVSESVMGQDLAYVAMLTYMPAGLLGVVAASLIAAYMSTMSTHLNWGSSYAINDFYKRFLRPEASERELVLAGRISIVLMMAAASLIGLWLEHAKQGFNLLIQFGAGTGLVFLLRWFWWRINAFSELTAMIVAAGVIVYFEFGPGEPPPSWVRILTAVAITTPAWLIVTFLTRPTAQVKLRAFYRHNRPGGPGWRKVLDRAEADGERLEDPDATWSVPLGLLCMVVGCVAVYSALFATGYYIYGNYVPAVVLTALAAGATWFLFRVWGRVSA